MTEWTTGLASHPFRSRIIIVKRASKTLRPTIEIRKKNKVELYRSTYPPLCWSDFLRGVFLRPKKVYRLRAGVGCFLRSLTVRLSFSFKVNPWPNSSPRPACPIKRALDRQEEESKFLNQSCDILGHLRIILEHDDIMPWED